MRHNYKGRKLGTDWSHTQAMKKSLVRALFENDRIKTIDVRAKEIRGDVDRIITWAKRAAAKAEAAAPKVEEKVEEKAEETVEAVADPAEEVAEEANAEAVEEAAEEAEEKKAE